MTYKITIDKYDFSSEAPLPSEAVLMQMLLDQVSKDQPSTICGIPRSIIEDETGKYEAFQETFDSIRQEASRNHPYIACIHDGPPPGHESQVSEESGEEEMCAYWLSTPEYSAYVEERAVPLAKSLGVL